MWGRSFIFDGLVRKGGVRKSTLEFVTGGDIFGGGYDVLLSATTDTQDSKIGLLGGDVNIDTGSFSRRRFSADLIAPTGQYLPLKADDILAVTSGVEVIVKTGFVNRLLADGEELLQVGRFVIDQPEFEDGPNGIKISLSGQDRSVHISDNLFLKPYVVHGGLNVVDAIWAVIRDRLPGSVQSGVNAVDVQHTTPVLQYSEHTNPTEVLDQLLKSAGLQLWFDIYGNPVVDKIPDPLMGDADWEFSDIQLPHMMKLRGVSSRDEVYNGVITVGENNFGLTPQTGQAWDEDPRSPTYRYGKFGQKVKVMEPNPAIVTKAQANEAAQAELRKTARLSIAYSADISPHPAAEGGDIIHLYREKLGIDANYVVQTAQIPLSGTQTGQITIKERL